MKKFFEEFKKFITRGNVLDLAVGVIVGGAFTAIVNGLTNNIIRPMVNWLISLLGGKAGLASAVTYLSKAYKTVDGVKTIDMANSIYIDWGSFIAAIIDFFIIAFAVFSIVKIINLSREKFKEFGDLIEKESKKEVRQEKKQYRKIAKEQGRKFKDVWKERLAEKQKALEEVKKAEEEKAKLEAEEAAKQNPSQETLLKEIRDLLKEQVSQKSTKSK
jgi:large conductance mechanosensitive channel